MSGPIFVDEVKVGSVYVSGAGEVAVIVSRG